MKPLPPNATRPIFAAEPSECDHSGPRVYVTPIDWDFRADFAVPLEDLRRRFNVLPV